MHCIVCEKQFHGHSSSEGSLVCGSCVLTSTTPEPSTAVNLDLEHTGRSSDEDTGSKSVEEVRLGLLTLAKTLPQDLLKENEVKRIKVKSNYARDRNVVLGSAVLTFDGDGIATCPESHMEALRLEMRNRPGRYWLVEDESAKKSPEPKTLAEAREAVKTAKVELKDKEKEEKQKKSDKEPSIFKKIFGTSDNQKETKKTEEAPASSDS